MSIQNEPFLHISEFNVETYKGVVQLSGIVYSPDDIRRAGDIAAGIPGVISVKNELTSGQKTDSGTE